MLKRLLYYLQLYKNKHPEKFAEYKDKVFIPGYYRTPFDFTPYSKEYLLLNVSSVRDYMQQDKFFKNRYVVPYVEPDKVEPYFFKNNLLGKRLYLAQNVTCYEHANYVMYYWRFMNRNPGDPSKGQKELTNTKVNDDLDSNLDLDLDLDLDEELISVPDNMANLDKVPYISFEVYKYVNENDIVLIRGDGNEKDKVLAYKVNNKVMYTVLLIE